MFKKSRSTFSQRLKGETGSIIVFVAVIALVLILLVGLAIDTSQIAATKTQQRQQAEKIALGALHSFNISPGGTPDIQLDDAVSRSKQILDVNFVLGDKFLYDTSLGKYVDDNRAATADEYGKITPGRWFFKEPDCSAPEFDPSDPCPCPGGFWDEPCFMEVDLTALNPPLTNAFKTELQFLRTNPIKTLFSAVGGLKDVTVSSEATAAKKPKNVVFLVDLSRSSHNETHFPYKQTTANYHSEHASLISGGAGDRHIQYASEYAFKMDETVWDQSCGGFAYPACADEGSCLVIGDSGAHNAVWNYLIARESPPTGDFRIDRPAVAATAKPNPPKHYVDDYDCYVPLDARFGPYLIDNFCQIPPPAGYTCSADLAGPEPLNSMLFGVRQGLEMMTVIDQAAIVGFDHSAVNLFRRFHSGIDMPDSGDSIEADLNPTGPYAPVPAREKTMGTLEPQIARALNVFDVETPNMLNFELRVVNHAFFPRVDAYADIGQALKEGLDVVKNSNNFEIAENIVIIFSDGLSNCFQGVCNEDYSTYADALLEAKTVIEDGYVDSGVKLYFFAIGNQIAPHELLRRGLKPEERSCMSRHQAADQGKSLVNFCSECDPDNPDACTECPPAAGPTATQESEYSDMLTGSGTFPGPAQLYSSVIQTGGRYIPIRKPCDPATGTTGISQAQCEEGDLQGYLDTQCAGAAVEGEVVRVLAPALTDADGRLACDPLCQTKRDQIFRELEKILSEDPYVIVE